MGLQNLKNLRKIDFLRRRISAQGESFNLIFSGFVQLDKSYRLAIKNTESGGCAHTKNHFWSLSLDLGTQGQGGLSIFLRHFDRFSSALHDGIIEKKGMPTKFRDIYGQNGTFHIFFTFFTQKVHSSTQPSNETCLNFFFTSK